MENDLTMVTMSRSPCLLEGLNDFSHVGELAGIRLEGKLHLYSTQLQSVCLHIPSSCLSCRDSSKKKIVNPNNHVV